MHIQPNPHQYDPWDEAPPEAKKPFRFALWHLFLLMFLVAVVSAAVARRGLVEGLPVIALIFGATFLGGSVVPASKRFGTAASLFVALLAAFLGLCAVAMLAIPLS